MSDVGKSVIKLNQKMLGQSSAVGEATILTKVSDPHCSCVALALGRPFEIENCADLVYVDYI